MAKRKRKVQVKKFEHSAELCGILFLLCSILGIGNFGPVGRLISSFALFLVGSIYIVLLLVLFILGAYLLIKREWPDFFDTKLIGIYIFLLGLLVIMHKNFVTENDGNMMLIFKETINQLVSGFNQIMNHGALSNWFSVGGGIIGGVFAILFDKMFSYTGMMIVSWVLMGLGICLFTGFSIIDYVREFIANRKDSRNSDKDKSSVRISDGNDEEDEDNHITISSIDQLTKTDVKDSNGKVVTNKDYQLPPLSILNKPKKKAKDMDNSVIEKNIQILEKVLKDFKINGKVVEVHIGPTVAQYEIEIASGTRVNKITSINRELALALAKKDVRIEAPIPGKNTVGVEFANDAPTPVSFYEIISSKLMMNALDKKLMVPLGKSIMGDIGVCEINRMPHLLIAGTTGAGKSVCVNGIICSILMRARPDEVKLVMVDPKVVELSGYNGIPHLMCPVVTDPKKASIALTKMVREMERRYEVFSDSKTKNIEGYNAYVEKWNNKHKDEQKEKLPYTTKSPMKNWKKRIIISGFPTLKTS